MGEIIDSPIVDIRAIKSQKHVINYVAKYITKAPAQFGTAKRYWCSRTYELDPISKPKKKDPNYVAWQVDQRPLLEILTAWMRDGFVSRRDEYDTLIGFRPPPGGRSALVGLLPRELE